MPDTQMDVHEFIRLVGDRLGVPKVFRDGIFGNESAGGRPDIGDSSAGAIGPGQLMPATAKRLGVNPRDPADNIIGSLRLQRQLLDKYRSITGDETKAYLLAAAAYNAGEGAVEKHGGIPPYAETQDYVKKMAQAIRKAGGSEVIKQGQKPQPEVGVDIGATLGKKVVGTAGAKGPFTSMPSAGGAASASTGLTPPPLRRTLASDLLPSTADVFTGTTAAMGPLAGSIAGGLSSLISEDTKRSFAEGVVGAAGATVRSVGSTANYLGQHPLLTGDVYGAVFGTKPDPLADALVSAGTTALNRSVQETSEHVAATEAGRFKQALTRGVGGTLVELPKLLMAAPYLGAATLPTFGAMGRADEGAGGLVKGAAIGAVYHYGGGVTGKYLGKFSNILAWVGGPAVEQHLTQGTPLGEAIAGSLPMGVFAGLGGQRAKIELADGGYRNARLRDIPAIQKGTLKLAEPQQVVMYNAVQAARARIIQANWEKVRTPQGEGEKELQPLSNIPDVFLPDLVQIGAFHYEAGSTEPMEWLGRMAKELGEHPSTLSPKVAEQLGAVYKRSEMLYKEGTAPTFVSGLQQTVKGLRAQGLIKDGIKSESLISLLRARGQAQELEDSGLLEALRAQYPKNDPVKVEDLLNWIEMQGMKQDVVRGERFRGSKGSSLIAEEEGGMNIPANPGGYEVVQGQDGWQVFNMRQNDYVGKFDNKEDAIAAANKLQNETYNVLPKVDVRSRFSSVGLGYAHTYFEGVITNNKAMNMSFDAIHFEGQPNQISWYRGGLVGYDHPDDLSTSGAMAILDEAQSRRSSKARRYGVTDDPNNPHSRLISLQQERESTHRELDLLEQQMDLEQWEPADEYSRYVPPDEGAGEDPVRSQEAIHRQNLEDSKQLDKLHARINQLDSEIQDLEHTTDTAPAPWAPHIDKETGGGDWYDPAIKGFLREAALRLEPDHEGNIFTTWSGATRQLDFYPSARKILNRIEWTRQGTKFGRDHLGVKYGPFSEEEAQAWAEKYKDRKVTIEDNPPRWDVTVYYPDPSRRPGRRELLAHTYHDHTEAQLINTFGDAVTERIVNNKYDKADTRTRDAWRVGGHDQTGLSHYSPGEPPVLYSLDAKKLPAGGEWSVRLYGDTEENIKTLWPEQPKLLEFAWKLSGNKALVAAWVEKYAKAWGGSLEMQKGTPPVPETADQVPYPNYGQPDSMLLTIPEAMRHMLLKEGQLMYGRRLAPLPERGKATYGLRNRITTEESIKEARDLIRKPLLRNLANIGPVEGGAPKEELDPRVKTDLAERGKDISGPGVFFRSTSKWLAGFHDSRIDWIAERIFDAEVREHDHTVAWGRRFDAISNHLKTAALSHSVTATPSGIEIVGERQNIRKLLGRKEDKAAVQQVYSQFIDLVEKPFKVEQRVYRGNTSRTIEVDNPDRHSPNPLIQRALEEHDALATEFKNYLIESYEARGIHIEDPDNWGITDKGYFRHLFPGENLVLVNGEFDSAHGMYVDAIVKANAIMRADPDAKIEIKQRALQFVDPAQRVSGRQYERLVQKVTGTVQADGYVNVSPKEIRQDLVGTIGKKENMGKFFAASLKREGYEGFLRDYEQVMKAHLFQLARSQELSKLRKDIQPTLETLMREGKRGVVEGIESFMSDLWGKPTNYEKSVGGIIRRFPSLAERVVNPDLGLEIAARRITSIHNILKLKYNPKAAFVNRIQPLRTLWPYLTTKDMMDVIKRYRGKDPNHPNWRQDMTELGVMSGAVKLETGGSYVKGFGAKEFFKDPFTYVSGSNRALGYTAGVIVAEKLGLAGYDAHKVGLRWAAKTEFDNSKWDTPRILRHSLGQVFGQYKGFLIKDLENTAEVFSKQQGDRPPVATVAGFEFSASKAARVGKWALGTGIAGGLRAATSPLAWLGTAAGYSMYLGAAHAIKWSTGMTDKDSKFYAALMFLGPPSMAGVDISSSVTPIDEPPGVTYAEKGLRFFGGPTVTGVYDIGRGTSNLIRPGVNEKRPVSERLFNMGTKISPYVRMVQRGFQLEQDLRTGQPQFLTLDGHALRLTKTQEVMGVFGVPPSAVTLYYEQKEATGKSPLAASGGSGPFGSPNRGFISSPFKPVPTR